MMPRFVFLFFFHLLIVELFPHDDIYLKEIDVNYGLSSKKILCFHEDSAGFMWIGTMNGLYRFNGYEFFSYTNVPGDTTTISNNMVSEILSDKYNRLWISTQYGLNIYDPVKGIFHHVFHEPNNKNSLLDNKISSLAIDHQGIIWVATRGGINKIIIEDTESIRIKRYHINNDLNFSYEPDVVEVFEDSDHELWVGTWGSGLYKFDRAKEVFINYTDSISDSNHPNLIIGEINEIQPGELLLYGIQTELTLYNTKQNTFKNKFNSNFFNRLDISTGIYSVFKSRDNKIWLGCMPTFYVCKLTSDKLVPVYSGNQSIYVDGKIRSKDQVRAVYEDHRGIIWLGYGSEGMDMYDPSLYRFSRWVKSIKPSTGWRDYITNMHVDFQNEFLWLGTFDDGLLKTDLRGNIIKRYLHNNNNQSISSNVIGPIQPVGDKYLWIGTKNGLNKFNVLTGLVENKFYHSPNDKYGLPHNTINEITRSGHYFWIVTQEGLCYFDSRNEKFINHTLINELKLNKINGIYKDSDSIFWIFAEDGLASYYPKLDSIKYFYNDIRKANTLISNYIRKVIEDENGNIWIATPNGLSRLNKRTSRFTNYFEKDGLPANSIEDLGIDGQGHIWFITRKGLSKLNTSTGNFINYGREDGLREKIFKLYINSGKFYLPFEKGIYAFYPESISDPSTNFPIFLTEFNIDGIPIHPGTGFMDTTIIYAKNIELNHDQNTLGFEFCALNFSNPGKNNYAYMLEGMDSSWIYLGNRREVTLMNLDPGNYKFLVKASNNENIWSDPVSINLRILPPWWKTWWAFMIYILVITSLLIIYQKLAVKRQQQKSKYEMERMEAKRLHELDELKLRFYTNVSHELRTPLTLIMGPLAQIVRSEVMETTKEKARGIYKNVVRLQTLINQLLDFRKIEVGKNKLEVVKGDIIAFIEKIVEPFKQHAVEEDIDFIVDKDIPSNTCYFDPDKLEKILTNIISNSFKYIDNERTIEINIGLSSSGEVNSFKDENDIIVICDSKVIDNEQYLKVHVVDTGKGMTDQEISFLFERFYRGNENWQSKISGSGIGLSLTKELIELSRGKLYVKSECGEGTTFYMFLPVSRKSFNRDEIKNDELSIQEINNFENTNAFGSLAALSSTEEFQAERKYKRGQVILIVEDNTELLSYLKDILGKQYIVKTASNGKEGLDIALHSQVDIIISDIMMPTMDGMELCNIIKNDEKTSHIPFIFLTAKSGDENQLTGLVTGADDYIVKPFQEEILLAKIQNIVNLRRKLWKRFNTRVEISASQEKITVKDKAFLDKLVSYVEMNITNGDLNNKKLYADIGMSRTQTYRKLKSLTNQSINQFINHIRLNKAMELIKSQEEYNMNEIAYMVGFSSSSYFIICFKNLFGMTPKQFQQDLLK